MAFNWFKNKKKVKQADEAPLGADENHGITEIEKTEESAVSHNAHEEKITAAVKDDKLLADEGELTAADIEDPDRDAPLRSKSGGFFKRLKNGLSKTRQILTTNIDDLFTGSRQIDEDMLEELEELLITADIGVQTTMGIVGNISKKTSKIKTAADLKTHLREELLALLPGSPPGGDQPVKKPHIVMVVGVNGVGKTTTIGKLASKDTTGGKKVLIAAADTFRAAAIEQLAVWAQRAGADIVKHRDNSDPAAVAFDGVAAAISRGMDRVYIDTAGRLHTKTNLMEELKKIKRSISKQITEAPHEILLVLDATTGQNAISQAEIFTRELGITGIVLTKLDGTAKGGIVIGICNALKIPLKYVGVGENIEDLQDFDPVAFVKALL